MTEPQRDLLWTVAQHKYGWTYASRHNGGLQVADSLVRRGFVEYGSHDRDHSSPIIVATGEGRAEIELRWPVSPFALGTYDHQPDGWTPREGVTTATAKRSLPSPDSSRVVVEGE